MCVVVVVVCPSYSSAEHCVKHVEEVFGAVIEAPPSLKVKACQRRDEPSLSHSTAERSEDPRRNVSTLCVDTCTLPADRCAAAGC